MEPDCIYVGQTMTQSITKLDIDMCQQDILKMWTFIQTGSRNGLMPGGTKPSPEPMLTYCLLDPREQILVKFK